MTSQKHFFKLLKENMTHKLWLFALSFFLYMGFAAACMTKVPIFFHSMDLTYGPGNSTLMWLTSIIAILCSFQSFSYLFQKKSTDFYFSLPLKRMTLFSVNYINSMLVFLIPFLLFFFLSTFGEHALNGTDLNQIVSYGTWEVLLTILGFLLVYHLSILAILLTGSLLTSIPLLMICFFYMQIWIQGICIPYLKMFYQTFYKSQLLIFLQDYFSPLLLYGKMAGIDKGLDVQRDPFIPETNTIIFTAICTFLLFAAVRFLYHRRPAEACHKACVFKYTEYILQWAIVIPSGLLSGLALSKTIGGSYKILLCIIGIVAASIIMHELSEMLFHFRFQKFFSKKLQLILQIGSGIAVLAVIILCQTSYDSYLPKESEIEKIGIAITDMDSNTTYAQWLNEDSLIQERLKACIVSKTNKTNAYEWIKPQASSNQKEDYTNDTIAFYLKNGQTIYRTYSISPNMLAQFDPIYQTIQYKGGLYDIMHLSSPRDRKFTWSNGVETLKLSLTDEEREQLLSIYQEELKQLSISDLKRELPNGTLTLKNEVSSLKGYLYPSFHKTIAFLEQKDIPVQKQIADYNITSITIKQYLDQGANYYGEVHRTLLSQKTFENSASIEQLKPNLVYSLYANQPLLYKLDTSYEFTIEVDSQGIQTQGEIRCYSLSAVPVDLK